MNELQLLFKKQPNGFTVFEIQTYNCTSGNINTVIQYVSNHSILTGKILSIKTSHSQIIIYLVSIRKQQHLFHFFYKIYQQKFIKHFQKKYFLTNECNHFVGNIELYPFNIINNKYLDFSKKHKQVSKQTGISEEFFLPKTVHEKVDQLALIKEYVSQMEKHYQHLLTMFYFQQKKLKKN